MDSYSFETGRQIPSSQLTALWNAQNSPSQLIHTVTLKGTKEPAYFSIVLDSDSTPLECIKVRYTVYSTTPLKWMAKGGQGECLYTQHARVTIYLPKILDKGCPKNSLQSDTFHMRIREAAVQ